MMMDEHIEAVKRLPKGARRAFDTMRGDWLRPGRITFAWAGAEQALKRVPALVERATMTTGRAIRPRDHYRLTTLGCDVAAALKPTT